MRNLCLVTLVLVLGSMLAAQTTPPLTAQALLIPAAVTSKLGLTDLPDMVVVYANGRTLGQPLLVQMTSQIDNAVIGHPLETTYLCICSPREISIQDICTFRLQPKEVVKMLSVIEYTAVRQAQAKIVTLTSP